MHGVSVGAVTGMRHSQRTLIHHPWSLLKIRGILEVGFYSLYRRHLDHCLNPGIDEHASQKQTSSPARTRPFRKRRLGLTTTNSCISREPSQICCTGPLIVLYERYARVTYCSAYECCLCIARYASPQRQTPSDPPLRSTTNPKHTGFRKLPVIHPSPEPTSPTQVKPQRDKAQRAWHTST